MSQTLDGGQSWSHAKADDHSVQTGCISTAGLPLTGQPDCANRNLVDFIGIDHLSDGNAVISYTYGCPTSTGCDGRTTQSNGAETRVVVQSSGSTIRGDVGQPSLTITSPEDDATVPAGTVDVSGVADRHGGGGGGELTATLSGPDKVANGAPAALTLTTTNAGGDVTCTIIAEGSPARANEAADGCSVDLTWTTDGTFTVTGEASDGTSTATDTLQVTVTSPSGIPEPDGSIAGGITIFSDLNPLVAHNEAIALFTSPVDPAPKFLPGEPATFHTRFTADSTGAAGPGGDPFTWHMWNSEGEVVATFGCTTEQDFSLTMPQGFDCQASTTMPSDIGRYYTTLRFDEDGRWSCHDTPPLVDVGFDNGIPQCLKAFDVVANTSTSTSASLVPRGHLEEAFPFLLRAGAKGPELEWRIRGSRASGKGKSERDVVSIAASPRPAPSEVPEDPEIVDPAGDALQVTNPGAGLPANQMDVEAAWFENDESFLYVGMKVVDIPADPATTAQVAYHVNFTPDWVTDPQTAYGVPANNTFTGLRVQAVLSLVGFDGALNNVVVDTGHHAELQHLSTTPTPSRTEFDKVTDLQVSVDPDTDIIWWAVPREALADPSEGDALSDLGANSALAVRGFVTIGLGDSATADEGRTFRFAGGATPLAADAGGPYSGAVNTPIAISGTATGGAPPHTCAWAGPVAAGFADPSACSTTVSFSDAGDFTIELTVTDGAGDQASASAPVTVGSAPQGERVEVFIDGTTLAGSTGITTDAGNPRAEWSVPVDMSGLSGEHTLTARWFDADDSLLSESTITVTVESSRVPTELALEVSEGTGKGKEKKRTLTAILTEDGGGVGSKTIVFYCDGAQIGTSDTDADGVAVFRKLRNCAKGSHVFRAVFEGDDSYAGSEAEATSEP